MDPDEKCRCKHERKWHDSCSKCACPFFLRAPAPASDLAVWRAHMAAVAAKAATRKVALDG